MQYTDFLLQDICEGQDTFQAHNRRDPPSLLVFTLILPMRQPSKLSSNVSFHITMQFYVLEGGELHFLLFLWLLSVDLYLCRANEW